MTLSVAFGYSELADWLDAAVGKHPGDIYSRNTNPTVAAFEAKIRTLERSEAAVSFSSGMAAISNTFFALLSPGDHVVSVKDTYGGTSKLLLEVLPRFGVRVTLCETSDHDSIVRAIRNGCTLAFLESPTNPTLKVLDLAGLISVAHESGTICVVDSTFATPINQRPIEFGADLVIHSATKYLGGHADALGGALCGRADLVEKVIRFREVTGAALDAMSAYLLLRGMKTLHLRIARQNQSAMAIASWLQHHPAVDEVYYPGLESHPNHNIAVRQMSGFGGVLSFVLKGGVQAMHRFLRNLRLVHRAANLGAVETIAGPPSTTSHVECSPEERAALGIPEALVRYSVGIEAPKDLMADLDQALRRAI